MRAVVLTAHGGPEAIEYVTDYPDPTPGPGEVLGKAAERLACYDKNFPPVSEKTKAAPSPSAQATSDDAEESRMKKALHAICVHC